jgi:hypothetical protein
VDRSEELTALTKKAIVDLAAHELEFLRILMIHIVADEARWASSSFFYRRRPIKRSV